MTSHSTRAGGIDTAAGRRDIALPLLTILGCVAVDQATKWLAATYLPKHDVISLAGDTVRVLYAENRGAFLSLGSSLPDHWRTMIFTVLVGVMLGALIFYLFFFAGPERLPRTALSCICGGGLSNLYDRIAYGGFVIDFLNVGIGPLRTGIFNIADMAIMAGTLLLLLQSFRPGSPRDS